MQRDRPAKLGDIARLAGVAPSTVSRVVNGSGYVSPETRAAVEAAVAQSGYVANGAARALASRRTRTIGALIPSFGNAISSQTIDTFQRVIEDAGYVLLVAGCEYDAARTLKNAEAMVGRGVDAMFIITVVEDERLYRLFRQYETPFLTTLPNERDDGVSFIGYNHCEAARRSTEFLLDLGHKDIGIVSTPRSSSLRLNQRLDAIRDVLASRNVRVRDELFVEEPGSSLANGRDAFRRLQAQAKLPTAILATNDVLAAGVVMECARQGIKIPDDISIMGYGDMDMAGHVTPALTTVRTPKAEIGHLAAKHLLDHLAGATLSSTTLPFEIVVRETTSKPKRLVRAA